MGGVADGAIKPNKISGSAGAHSHTVNIQNTGNSTAHNNLPPFISIYIFRRTA